MPTAVRGRSSIPSMVVCETAKQSGLCGEYRLVTDRRKYPRSLVIFNCNEFAECVYERVCSPNIYLIYCESEPELLPGDLWDTVVAEALAANAEANMSAAVSIDLAPSVSKEICDHIMRVATSVSKELLGWIIVSVHEDAVTPLARCVQRVPESEPAQKVGSFIQYSWPEAVWEVRSVSSTQSSEILEAEWLSNGLSINWLNMLTQSGEFEKDPSFTVTPIENAKLVKPVGINSFEWDLSTSGLDPCDPSNWKSLPFSSNGEEYVIVIRPMGFGLISIGLCRLYPSDCNQTKFFRVKVESVGESGQKMLKSDYCAVVFELPLNSATTSYQDVLRKAIVSIEFL